VGEESRAAGRSVGGNQLGISSGTQQEQEQHSHQQKVCKVVHHYLYTL
jgi:hypothetical protein